jgi:hypothetical protein
MSSMHLLFMILVMYITVCKVTIVIQAFHYNNSRNVSVLMEGEQVLKQILPPWKVPESSFKNNQLNSMVS